MKKITIVILLLLIVLSGSAQSRWSAFLQQMAAMETYLQTIKAGYKTTTNGLNTVHKLKDGSFSLNSSYFSSLRNVSPVVKNNAKIQGITDVLQKIESVFQKAIAWQRSKRILSGDELQYMQSVYSHLLDECNKDIAGLQLVISDNQSQMSDAARITYIDRLYATMQDRYAFSCAFTTKARQPAECRSNMKNSNQAIQKLYGTN